MSKDNTPLAAIAGIPIVKKRMGIDAAEAINNSLLQLYMVREGKIDPKLFSLHASKLYGLSLSVLLEATCMIDERNMKIKERAMLSGMPAKFTPTCNDRVIAGIYTFINAAPGSIIMWDGVDALAMVTAEPEEKGKENVH